MKLKEIYLGAGCFWGVEAYFQKVKGIIKTEAGYLNGKNDLNRTTYQAVSNGSGHVEVVKLIFDQEILSYQDLFTLYLQIIDPFSLNKQGNDFGKQYRTGIYSNYQTILNAWQKILLNWEKTHQKSMIEIKLLKNYTKAEKEHQDYLQKNPTGYCHINLNNLPNWAKK